MKTYFENGTLQEVPYFLDKSDMFYIQELEGDRSDKYVYPSDSIKYELDTELVSLYDKFRDAFFGDTNEYYRELRQLPIFAQEAGQDSECSLTAEVFSELLQREEFTKIPNFYRHLYLVDCQFLIGTIQNLLSGMEDSFVNYYTRIANIGNDISPSASNATMYEMSQSVRCISSLLESYFVKAYSILDMLCKIGYEFQFAENEFTSYKKMKSADLLWGARKKLQINNSADTLFEKCDLVSMVESLRNEVVHNGTWELNPKVFIRFDNEMPVERFMLFPDTFEGRLATVKNRKHFFGNGTKVNYVFPQIHIAYQRRLLNTVKLLNSTNAE
ncbi:MAG: hypothetical protein Q4A15_02150 [Prevotellaceae bacterium]|nr:hypothetical protein [Prevotellaceae bacterium]